MKILFPLFIIIFGIGGGLIADFILWPDFETEIAP